MSAAANICCITHALHVSYRWHSKLLVVDILQVQAIYLNLFLEKATLVVSLLIYISITLLFCVYLFRLHKAKIIIFNIWLRRCVINRMASLDRNGLFILTIICQLFAKMIRFNHLLLGCMDIKRLSDHRIIFTCHVEDSLKWNRGDLLPCQPSYPIVFKV